MATGASFCGRRPACLPLADGWLSKGLRELRIRVLAFKPLLTGDYILSVAAVMPKAFGRLKSFCPYFIGAKFGFIDKRAKMFLRELNFKHLIFIEHQ